MTDEKEKILTMVAEGQISAREGEQLVAALNKKRVSTRRFLLNPFERLSQTTCLLVALLFASAGVAIATYLGARFDGALDVHVNGRPLPLSGALVDLLLSWPFLALFLWLAALVVGRQGRLIDFLSVVGIARAANVTLALVVVLIVPDLDSFLLSATSSPLDPILMLVAFASLPFVALFFTWLFFGFKTASGLSGGRLALAFVAAVVLAEVASKALLWAAPASLYSAQEPAQPYRLPGDSPEERAKAFVDLLERGEVDKAWRSFNEKMADAVSRTELSITWRATQWKVGRLKKIEERRVTTTAGNTIVDLVCAFESERLRVRVVLDEEQRVAGLWFLPPDE